MQQQQQQQQQRQSAAFPLPHPSQAPHNQLNRKLSPFLFLLFLRPLTDMNSKSQHHARTDRCTGIMKKKRKKKRIFMLHPGPLIFTALAARHPWRLYGRV